MVGLKNSVEDAGETLRQAECIDEQQCDSGEARGIGADWGFHSVADHERARVDESTTRNPERPEFCTVRPDTCP